MKFLPIGCLACSRSKNVFLDRTALLEGRAYKYVCDCGATSVFFNGHEKFELLFEAGMQALTEGFLREAILDFTACLERTYESVIRTLLVSRSAHEAAVESVWKQVASSSERQFGMFVGLWTSEFNDAPQRFPQKQVELRNDVVHKGIFCTDEQAISYGQAVWDFWATHWGPVADKHHSHINSLWRTRAAEVRKSLLPGQWFADIQATKNMSSQVPVHRDPLNVAEVISEKRLAPKAYSYAMIVEPPRGVASDRLTLDE